MAWWRIDDGAAKHRKVRAAKCEGRALWYATGSEIAALLTDGQVPADMLDDWCYLAGVERDEATGLLVASGLWHDQRAQRRCDRCAGRYGRIGVDDFYYHDWLDYNPTKDQARWTSEQIKKKRADDLHKNRELCTAVIKRDGMLCRYCGCRVKKGDQRSPVGFTYDHVDPDGPNAFGNVVVACRRCNGNKRDRTPEEAGMVLLPPHDPMVPDPHKRRKTR